MWEGEVGEGTADVTAIRRSNGAAGGAGFVSATAALG